MKPKLVILTGAGISAESGLKTFRDNDGLWENYNIYDVATPEAFAKDPEMVLEFYNLRRKNVREALPNIAHIAVADLEEDFDVDIITQNVDDLHERAGSTNILHLHGEILKVRSSLNEELVYDCDGEIKLGDFCELGSQLRPHIVWFGEDVPLLLNAAEIVKKADVLLIIGTSLQVYPAASLVDFTKEGTQVIVLDPGEPFIDKRKINLIQKKATEGIADLRQLLLVNKIPIAPKG